MPKRPAGLAEAIRQTAEILAGLGPEVSDDLSFESDFIPESEFESDSELWSISYL